MIHSRKKITRTVVANSTENGSDDTSSFPVESENHPPIPVTFARIEGNAIEWKTRTQDSLAKQTMDLVEQMSSEGVLNTRIMNLVNDDLKTPGAHFIARQFKTLVSQIAIIYEMDSFEQAVAPYIHQKYEELGEPSLIPGSVGSYIFGCYLSNYGGETLNRFCTPICAASIRIPNPSGTHLLRCRQKVIWTDGGETPVFILIEDTLENTHSAKVFLPWPSVDTIFLGLTQGAIQEIRDFDVGIVQIYGQLPSNQYVLLMDITPIAKVPVVPRIYLSPIEEIQTRNAQNVVSEHQIVKLQTVQGVSDSSSTMLFILVGVGVIIAVAVGLLYTRTQSENPRVGKRKTTTP